jgi:hypothetical protein
MTLLNNHQSASDNRASAALRARREFLIRSAAACAAGSSLLNLSSQSLWAMRPEETARQTAQGFLASLSAEQRSLAQIDYNDGKRSAWHFIPMESRKGLPLRDMNDQQRTAAMGLMASLLSESGFRRAVDIMAYEAILLELEGPAQAKRRDYRKFYFSIYGNPEPNAPWGVSIEGHHLSVNMTYEGDRIVDSTPQFFGVNPAKLLRDFETPDPLKSGDKKKYTAGTRLLLPEEQAAYELLGSLSKDQQAKAIFQSDCPEDIQWPGEPQPKVAAAVGIVSSELNADQQKKLRAILDAYFSTMPKVVAQDRLKLIEQNNGGKIHFGWAGGTDPKEQHFIRIQGPTFIAELCNFQTDPQGTTANHIHSVWRDLTGDFNLSI